MPKDLIEEDISDLDSNDEGDIPAQQAVKDDADAEDQVNGELKDEAAENDDKSDVKSDDNDDSEQEDGEDLYVVEAIRNHKVEGKKNKTIRLLIKWRNYEDKDNTWEPEDNLLPTSAKLLADYYETIGGRPDTGSQSVPPKSTPRPINKRKSTQSLTDSATPAPSKKSKRNGLSEVVDWLPTTKSWENDIERVDTIERNPETKKLTAYVYFKNGKLAKVGMEKCYKHCPMAMLKFYEEHLKFT